jgi:cytidylate kinase
VPRTVVCISRLLGAQGEQIGRLVAERLGFSHLDEEIVTRAAVRGGLDPGEVADAEQRKSFLRRLLGELGQEGGAEASGFVYFFPSLVDREEKADAAALIREAIEETASEGRVVLVAHAASYALAGRPELLRVLVTASAETRASRLAEGGGLGAKEAARTVKDSDAARADYLRRFYEVDAELPTHYDVVVNTDGVGVEEAAALIAEAAAGSG